MTDIFNIYIYLLLYDSFQIYGIYTGIWYMENKIKYKNIKQLRKLSVFLMKLWQMHIFWFLAEMYKKRNIKKLEQNSYCLIICNIF